MLNAATVRKENGGGFLMTEILTGKMKSVKLIDKNVIKELFKVFYPFCQNKFCTPFFKEVWEFAQKNTFPARKKHRG